MNAIAKIFKVFTIFMVVFCAIVSILMGIAVMTAPEADAKTAALKALDDEAFRNPPARQPSEADLAVTAAVYGVIELKSMMHDPKRFELVDAVAISKNVACYEYRAANGFGGIRSGSAVLINGVIVTSQSKKFVKIWNKECTKQSLSNVTAFSQQLIGQKW